MLSFYQDYPKRQITAEAGEIFTMEKLMTEIPEVEEIEINPVIITHEKTYCVDVKVKI